MMITLFYVVPSVPPQFWDDGHILTPQERQDRQGVIDKWVENQKRVMEPHFEKAKKMLIDEHHFESRQVEGKMRSDVTSVAEAVVEEARSGAIPDAHTGAARGDPYPCRQPVGSHPPQGRGPCRVRCGIMSSNPGTMPGIAVPDLHRADFSQTIGMVRGA